MGVPATHAGKPAPDPHGPGEPTRQPGGSAPFGRVPHNEPQDLISGRSAAGPLAHVQGLLAVGAALNGALATLLPHPAYYNVVGLLVVQVAALAYGLTVLLGRDKISLIWLRIGNLCAAVMTTAAVYFSGDSTSGYAIFYLWIGFYVFYYPVSRFEAAMNLAFAAACYGVAIMITPTPPPDPNSSISFFSVVAGTLITAGVLLTYLRQRVERLMSRLLEASRTDPLTELPNRVGLQQALEREFERARPNGRQLSLLVLDLDRFKSLNERFGIGTGDKVIKELGDVLNKEARLIDTLARSGGEEFALLMPETDQHEAFLIAEQLLSKIRCAELPTGQVTASAGIASFPAHGADPAALISYSDKALYAAKALGRDRVVIYSPEVTSTVGAVAGRRNVEDQAQLATVLSLAEALDQRDSGTARHSQTVGLLCEMMAQELGFDDDRVQRVRLAGILHDIGKIGVSDSILCKPGPLTDEEFAQMRRHPELGARILSSSELDDVRSWILAHHERPDGTGYPHGLTAEEIPLEAAILAVGDAYEAMTADRVYRRAIGPEAARAELKKWSGKQFDERVVRAFLRALDNAPEGAEFTLGGRQTVAGAREPTT